MNPNHSKLLLQESKPLNQPKKVQKSAKKYKMQKVAKQHFLQIIVVKLKMRLYGVSNIQMEVITIQSHVLNIPTRGKGHCTDGGQHW